MIIDEDDYKANLIHYGTPRKSGRYPWGSGDNESSSPARNPSLIDMVKQLRREGLSEKDIAKGLGFGSTTQLRAKLSIAKSEKRASDVAMARRLKEKGLSNPAIAQRMNLAGESSVRLLLADDALDKSDKLQSTVAMLKRQVDERGWIDVGVGTENYLDISKDKLNVAVTVLKEQGYALHKLKRPQVGTGLDTEYKVLAPPGTTQREIFMNPEKIQSIIEFSNDGGKTYNKTQNPIAISPSRVGIVYGPDGGSKADGVMYIRPGIKDLSLGGSNYAQVRVQVGPKHYAKGMAMHKDDLPDGVDLLFHTNKKDTGNKLDALKELSDDPNLPFGSVIRRQVLDDKGKVTSAMNIVHEEGDWTTWSKTISSQVLSKQDPRLARDQLNMTYEGREQEFKEIMKLTNPTIKKKLLETFADSTDSAAVHLQAAQLPRQGWYAILPINSLKDTEVYAPRFRDGESVVLIRHPHGGTFEIPELKVNNKHPESKRLLGNAPDAIGINVKVAERLSGADFDGDTVLVIPNNARRVKTSAALEGLKNFDPKAAYPPYDGMRTMDGGVFNARTGKVDYQGKAPSTKTKQQEMGNISNLITDMTIKQASHDQIARAVRHSMVVIDAEKHHLNYKESARANGIAALKAEYQGSSRSGASTLISRARSEKRIPARKPRPVAEGGPIDEAGRKVFVPTNQMRTNKDGVKVPKLQKVKELAITDDANALSSGTPIERVYATHSNKLKNLANEARLAASRTPNLSWSPSAKKVYAKEVESLNAKLALANRNKPRERQAQLIANAIIRAKRAANPNLEGDSLKKVRFQALAEARARVDANKDLITFEPNEWRAIQEGAISNAKLAEMLNHADLEQVRKLATPRQQLKMSSAKIARAQAMAAQGYTAAEIADQLGVSTTTLSDSIKSEGAYE